MWDNVHKTNGILQFLQQTPMICKYVSQIDQHMCYSLQHNCQIIYLGFFLSDAVSNLVQLDI